MSSQSGYAGSAGSNFVTAGTVTWSNTGNATGSPNGSNANTPSSLGSGTVTQSLDAYNFGLTIPGGATITGIEVVITALRGAVTSRIVDVEAPHHANGVRQSDP